MVDYQGVAAFVARVVPKIRRVEMFWSKEKPELWLTIEEVPVALTGLLAYEGFFDEETQEEIRQKKLLGTLLEDEKKAAAYFTMVKEKFDKASEIGTLEEVMIIVKSKVEFHYSKAAHPEEKAYNNPARALYRIEELILVAGAFAFAYQAFIGEIPTHPDGSSSKNAQIASQALTRIRKKLKSVHNYVL